MKINVAKVLTRAKEREIEKKNQPLPKVKVSKRSPITERIMADTPVEVRERVRTYGDAAVSKHAIIKELEADMIALKKERAILSSQIAPMVEKICESLKGDAYALQTFMEGGISMPELQAHYAKIEALTDRGAEIYDEIRYVEAHGERPPSKIKPIAVVEASDEAKAIQYEIRRLDDRIHKTGKKLKGKLPKNLERIATWNEKIALDEARRNELKHKLNELHYGSRAKRTSEA